MNSKLITIFAVLALVLIGVCYYLFISFNDTPSIATNQTNSQRPSTTINTPKTKEYQSLTYDNSAVQSESLETTSPSTSAVQGPVNSQEPSASVANSKAPAKSANSSTPKASTSKDKAPETKSSKSSLERALKGTNSASNSGISLRAEYEALLKQSKQNTSLGEPRYRVFVLDNAKLSKAQRQTINEITTTLSKRGAYFHYTLFVKNLPNDNMQLTLFNESLLDETNFSALKGPLPLLWFKFNQSSIQSVKNSFHIKNFKAQLPEGSKFRSLTLSGFADDFGSKNYNNLLGLKRDSAVAAELLRIFGKIEFLSYGKDKPMTLQQDEKHRYQNRRVESLIDSY